jgi:ribA/ribD-fused uncharacterized protein
MAEQFTFFYHSSSVFSQWYEKAPFSKYGIRFKTAENFMMWRKGQLFGAPPALLDKIINADSRNAKAIGRNEITHFNEAIWDVAAVPCVTEGNIAKFSQNREALAILLATEGTTLVEASPSDRIWGIGLSARDPRAQQRETWLGLNKLGDVLTDIRDTFLRVR